MTRPAATHVIEQLAAWGVRHLFGLPGDTVIPLLEALRRQQTVRYIGVRHEESAGFMASAYAKLTGRLAACMAEAGPATVHLLNGVYDAHLDRVPLLALTGQSATRHLGTHWPQTVNQDLLFEDATCFNHTLATPAQLPAVLYRALRTAETTPGAARLGLPVDLQAMTTQGPLRQRPSYLTATPAPPGAGLKEAASLLAGARRPVIFVGQGSRSAARAVAQLAERLKAAIIHTMPALGIIPAAHPRNLGVIGEFGTDAAAEAFGQADVVLVIGSTWWQPKYVPAARFIQIDRQQRHLGMLFPAEVGIAAAAADAVPRLLERLQRSGNGSRRAGGDWDETITALKTRRQEAVAAGRAGRAGQDPLDDGRQGLRPHRVVQALQQQLAQRAIICLDVGDNTFWMSHLFQAAGQRLLISGHWRSMGFALPAAIAAALAAPQRPVVAVVGDGGFAMTMAEFLTAVALDLPICVIVLNNGVLAQEGHEQHRMRLAAFGVSLHNPSFAEYGRICGGGGFEIKDEAELARHLPEALTAAAPMILDVHTRPIMPEFPKGRGSLMPQPTPKDEQAGALR